MLNIFPLKNMMQYTYNSKAGKVTIIIKLTE